MAEYGLVVKKDSFAGHVEDANSSQLAIDTRLLVPKIHSRGSGSVTSKTSGTLAKVTIPHGLGYAPDCEVYFGTGAQRRILSGDYTAVYPFTVSIDATNLYIEQNVHDSFASLYNYYYYIFLEDAD